LYFSRGLLAAYYGPDWPVITALPAGENGHMHFCHVSGLSAVGVGLSAMCAGHLRREGEGELPSGAGTGAGLAVIEAEGALRRDGEAQRKAAAGAGKGDVKGGAGVGFLQEGRNSSHLGLPLCVGAQKSLSVQQQKGNGGFRCCTEHCHFLTSNHAGSSSSNRIAYWT
jgi:hypothetical protein